MISRSRFRRRRAEADCREVGKALQHYLDGEVEADFADKIAGHLEDCRRCGLEVETYTRIKESLGRRLPEVDQEAIDRLRAFGEELTGDG